MLTRDLDCLYVNKTLLIQYRFKTTDRSSCVSNNHTLSVLPVKLTPNMYLHAPNSFICFEFLLQMVLLITLVVPTKQSDWSTRHLECAQICMTARLTHAKNITLPHWGRHFFIQTVSMCLYIFNLYCICNTF